MKKTGMSRKARLSFDPVIIEGGGSTVITKPNTWYVILNKGIGSTLPAEIPLDTIFKSPISGTQYTLITGDKLLEVDFKGFCKTNASFSGSQGTIDAGDDCNPGEKLRDGITAISGSLEGFLVFDDVTEQLVDEKIGSILNDLRSKIEENKKPKK